MAKAASDKTEPVPVAKAAKSDPDPGLVTMHKEGATIAVHPSCVHAHRAIGWVEA